jgi:hypothetical protein
MSQGRQEAGEPSPEARRSPPWKAIKVLRPDATKDAWEETS